MTKTNAVKQIAADVTKAIIEDLQNGSVPWIKPWSTENISHLPANGKTGNFYNGINWLNLLIRGDAQGFYSNQWFTYSQAKELGGTINKGSKGSRILFCKPVHKEVEANEEPEIYMATKSYTVFAREQISGLSEAKKYANKTLVELDQFIASTTAQIKFGGGRAYFSPTEDYIQMPNLDRFLTPDDYYATTFHELVHWTGHKLRLNRDCSNYAFEELVAELGAAFLCAKLGIKGQLQHSEYIGHWIKALNNDYRFITQAASKAQQAVNYLVGKA
jgi:antirestriction protein ArdC